MNGVQQLFLVNRYKSEVEREAQKLLAHPFFSTRDWSNSVKVNDWVRELKAFLMFAGARFELVRGLYRLTQNEGNFAPKFFWYAGASGCFAPLGTWTALLSGDACRQEGPHAESNEIAENIVRSLNDCAKWLTPPEPW
jgi:hypothetical protein